MILYPAIDLLDGRIVRLEQGAFDSVTDYGDDPAAVAVEYAAAGAEWLHVVDLSGARDGGRRQTDVIQSLSNSGLKLQVGGGIRSDQDIEVIFRAGVSRVIVGSLAVTNPEKVNDWIRSFGPHRIVAAFDVRVDDGIAWPQISGWTKRGDEPLASLLERYADSGLEHALVTDVGRDGLLEGPNTALYEELADIWPLVSWQASGGVASLDDLRRLKQVKASGAIVGKALYERRFSLSEALLCLRDG